MLQFQERAKTKPNDKQPIQIKGPEGAIKEKVIPWVTDKDVQLEILTLKDSEAVGERYFVPNGARGQQWLQCYFQGWATTTSGILQQNEIRERKGKKYSLGQYILMRVE